jgi:hypothetical protein
LPLHLDGAADQKRTTIIDGSLQHGGVILTAMDARRALPYYLTREFSRSIAIKTTVAIYEAF